MYQYWIRNGNSWFWLSELNYNLPCDWWNGQSLWRKPIEWASCRWYAELVRWLQRYRIFCHTFCTIFGLLQANSIQINFFLIFNCLSIMLALKSDLFPYFPHCADEGSGFRTWNSLVRKHIEVWCDRPSIEISVCHLHIDKVTSSNWHKKKESFSCD